MAEVRTDIDVLRGSMNELVDAWDAVIDELGADGLERPGANGDWRVRDVLAHLTGWERWQIVQLRNAFARGPDPSKEDLVGRVDYPEEDHFLTEDERNAVFTEINKDRPLDDVIADFREVSAMYTDWIASASQNDIDTPIGVKFTERSQAVFRVADVPDVANVQTTASWFDNLFLTHRREHLGTVRTWMREGGAA